MRLRIHSLCGSGMRATIDSGNRTPILFVVSSLIGGLPIWLEIASNAMPSRYPRPICFLNSSSLVAAANHILWSAPVPNFLPWYARRNPRMYPDQYSDIFGSSQIFRSASARHYSDLNFCSVIGTFLFNGLPIYTHTYNITHLKTNVNRKENNFYREDIKL